VKEIYSKYNDQGKELEQQNRALAAMSEKFDEATKAAEESERFDLISNMHWIKFSQHITRFTAN